MSNNTKGKKIATKSKMRKPSKIAASKTTPVKSKKKPVIEKELSQDQILMQQEISRLESALHSEKEQFVLKENELLNRLSTKTADIIALEKERSQENQLIQSQNERLQNIEKELTQVQTQSQQVIARLESILHSEREKSETLTRHIEDLNESKNNLSKDLEREQEEKAAQIAKTLVLDKQLQDGNLTIENLLNQKMVLESQFQDKKQQIALEWARGLGEVLTKLSALAEKEPEAVRGLKPRAVYETLLSWLEKTFGERPKMFPSSKEFTLTSDGKYLITLDADADGIEALLKRYDWSHEHPFGNKPEGQRQCEFKIIQWGWKVSDTILVRANVTIWHVDQ